MFSVATPSTDPGVFLNSFMPFIVNLVKMLQNVKVISNLKSQSSSGSKSCNLCPQKIGKMHFNPVKLSSPVRFQADEFNKLKNLCSKTIGKKMKVRSYESFPPCLNSTVPYFRFGGNNSF